MLSLVSIAEANKVFNQSKTYSLIFNLNIIIYCYGCYDTRIQMIRFVDIATETGLTGTRELEDLVIETIYAV